MLPLPSAWAHETRLSTKVGILELWDSAALIISGTGVDTVCSFSPSIGQRNQYQSQGASQTPSATQTGQRGQGMGQGQGWGSQVGTSEMQERVYAVVP